MNPLLLLKVISPRGWLAISGLVLVVAFIAMGAALVSAHDSIRDLKSELTSCTQKRADLEKQIKDRAVEEGKAYAKTEADHLAACRDAFDAGARRLRDDKAIGAGRYVPGSGSSAPSR